MAVNEATPFKMERLGVIMQPDPENPYEAWGVLNPGGTRGPDGNYYLFPRVVAEGNYSRIGRARVIFAQNGNPSGAQRLGYALEPHEPYEVSKRLGGGVEDPRVAYLEPLRLYVMTYTAFTPHHPRIALAVSRDLITWKRLGPLRFATGPDEFDLNSCGNKDGLVFPGVVHDPHGRPCMAIIHRPTYALHGHPHRPAIILPPAGAEHLENIWISYAPLEHAHADIQHLTHVHEHQVLLAPEADWEQLKIGGGAPPVRLPYGWLLLYHGVCGWQGPREKHVRYSAGVAVLDLEDPTKVLYRSRRPVLEPELSHETEGVVPGVVFPTATDLRGDGRLDVYYGCADTVVAAARLSIPPQLPQDP
jgi:predicted GH43/DUF377 family glycosyl hydrolase